MSLICDNIKNNPDWKQLMEELHIKVTYDTENNYALFKYNIDADFSNPIVREARGIIIDLDEIVPVCRPFDKFGNYGEPYVPEIDWSTARVQEKMDGSIIKMWYSKKENRWRISTNGCIDAFSTENSEDKNFGWMFVDAVREQNPEVFLQNTPLEKDYTYMFELIGPDNQIVVQYNKNEVYHIGTRHNITGQEVDTNIRIQKPKEYNLSSLEECIDFANTFAGTEHEGFVVVDSNWNRIKVKAEDYLRLHYMAGNNILTIEKMIGIIKNNEVEEYCTYFPKKREGIDAAIKLMEEERLVILADITDARNLNQSRKEYAIAHHNDPHFSFVMSVVYNNKELDIPDKYWIKFLGKEN